MLENKVSSPQLELFSYKHVKYRFAPPRVSKEFLSEA